MKVTMRRWSRSFKQHRHHRNTTGKEDLLDYSFLIPPPSLLMSWCRWCLCPHYLIQTHVTDRKCCAQAECNTWEKGRRRNVRLESPVKKGLFSVWEVWNCLILSMWRRTGGRGLWEKHLCMYSGEQLWADWIGAIFESGVFFCGVQMSSDSMVPDWIELVTTFVRLLCSSLFQRWWDWWSLRVCANVSCVCCQFEPFYPHEKSVTWHWRQQGHMQGF